MPLIPPSIASAAAADVPAFADLAAQIPLPVWVVLGLVVLLFVIRSARAAMPVPLDPVRAFSPAQRSEGFSRANGQCELEGWWFTRCRKPASHGDHHFPHSKGGSTTMGNFVAACVRCNTSKGARIPTAGATLRIQRRRRKYFPTGLPVKAGEKYRQP